MDFETLYRDYVEKCSHETAFNKEEAKALYDLASNLPEASNIVEIGVEFGRSTTVLGQVSKERGHKFVAIDAWLGEYSPQARKHVEDVLIKEWGLPIRLWSQKSGDVARMYLDRINLIHIDGDHTYDGVMEDCKKWLPKVAPDGYVCFDDYGHDSLPEVYAAVSDYMKDNPDWDFVERVGNKLGIYRRTWWA